MTIPHIREINNKVTELFEQIDEYKGYINQLSTGVLSKLGSREMNFNAITEYQSKIAELENEINQIWNSK